MGDRSVLECIPQSIDATIAQNGNQETPQSDSVRDCSLVQIYPANIVDGLVRIDCELLTIGRESSNDLSLPDGSVSRFHAQLERCDDGYYIRDLGSTNGTLVDDEPIAEKLLRGGEIIRVGSFIFKFLAANGIEAQYHSTVYNAMTRDGLTGAFNKNYLLDTLEREISRSRRCFRPVSVLLMDIDHFKKINDTYGHLVGDEVLREFSKRIARSKRPDDMFCRYGGEEFVLILGETTLEEAIEIAELCRLHVAATMCATSGGDIQVHVSMGAAQLQADDPTTTVASLLKLADDRLYQAKQNGRNRVVA
jgi:diguanylate cyclase (GGDEF)-like protein